MTNSGSIEPDASTPINTTMDREVLLSGDGQQFVRRLDALRHELVGRRLPVTSWYGALPRRGFARALEQARALARLLRGREPWLSPGAAVNRGGAGYEPVPGIRKDDDHPWFLYWEAFWVLRHGPQIAGTERLLDAGGTASLFSSHLASLGARVDSVDINEKLVDAGNAIAHATDMTALAFDDASFDHAYSICVFEHLDHDARRRALREIARVLRPGGILSLTFDYGGPGVYLSGRGHDHDPRNLIRSPEDIHRHFLSTDAFEPAGNLAFHDNGRRYLLWPGPDRTPYTFGALFLRRR